MHDIIVRIVQRFVRKIQSRTHWGATVRSVYGVKLLANHDDRTFKHYWYGNYGWFYWNHVSERQKQFVYLDIGANQGLYTICAARNSSCLECLAFEPVETTFTFLEKNLLLNGVGARCRVFKLAVSDTVGEVAIRIDTASSGKATLATDRDFSKHDSTQVIRTIDGIALTDLIRNQDTEICVKVDVEGHELTVIRELLSSELSDRIVEIFFEVDEAWIDITEIENLLEGGGFRSWKKIGAGSHYDILAQREDYGAHVS